MLDANKKREMMEEIVKNIMQRMKEQGMSDKEILKTIKKISKQGIEEEWIRVKNWPNLKENSDIQSIPESRQIIF